MGAPFYYPYSTTFLIQHMERISRGIVVLGLAVISAGIMVFAAIGVWNIFT